DNARLPPVDGGEVLDAAAATGTQGDHPGQASAGGAHAAELPPQIVDDTNVVDPCERHAYVATEGPQLLQQGEVNHQFPAVHSQLGHLEGSYSGRSGGRCASETAGCCEHG